METGTADGAPGGRSRRAAALGRLSREVTRCRRCPRLVGWREEVARRKRAAYADHEYWGRPVPGFGDPEAMILVVGLAPGAHGANRTGRMFTGDRSGEWLYRALFRARLADRPDSIWRGDGLRLDGAYITAAVRCAPPANKPTRDERGACRPFLEREMELFADVPVIVTLGGFAFASVLGILRDRSWKIPSPRPRFSHGLEVSVGRPDSRAATGPGGQPDSAGRGCEPLTVLASYHPSQQNTFTGRLTEEMFDAVWSRAVELSR